MLRVLVALSLLLAGCETCDQPGDPRIRVIVTVERPTTDGEYLHTSMFNALGQHLDSRRSDAASYLVETLGDCDDVLQYSGEFKVLAWVSTSSELDDREPAPGDPQGMDLVDVDCDSDGCYARRDAHITIR